MEFLNSQSYRCFKSVCFWSLLSNLMVILSFFASYSFSFAYHDWGYVGWIVPVIVKVFLIWCFAIAIGYLVFILFLESRKVNEQLPLLIVTKTESLFNNIFKNDLLKIIVYVISLISFIFDIFVATINFYTIIISLITFFVLLIIYKIKRN